LYRTTPGLLIIVMKKGFTLIETLLYIAIFGIILVAGISAAYNLIESTTRFNNKILVESEANFVLRKLSLSLENVTAVNSPNAQTLCLTRQTPTGTENLIFTINGSVVTLDRPGASCTASAPIEITTGRVTVGSFVVDHEDDPFDSKAGAVQVDFEIDGRAFSIRRFLRTDTT
jgi:prepilin-type N-terminal cleavage/methylation domain-containing protein